MSPTSEKEQIETNNRRLNPRGTFRGAVLVFFGLGKWGKLINISEGGMAFEFYELPPNGERLSFGLEVMGRESEPSGRLATDSIRADGQVVWTRAVERCAGVQFLDVSEPTLRQIRTWLSIEPSSGAGNEGGKVRDDAIETGVSGPPLTLPETKKQGTDQGQLRDTEFAQSSNLNVRWNPGFDEPNVEERSGTKSQINQAARMSMVPWLAVFAILAGITAMILPQRVHLAALFQNIRERFIDNQVLPHAGERSVTKVRPAFEVEAVDMNNRRRLLTFDNDASAVEPWLSSAAPSTPSKNFLVNRGAPPAERTTEEKRRSLSNLTLSGPRLTRPATNVSTANSAAPVIDSGTASRDSVRAGSSSGEILANAAAQLPAAPPAPVSGEVQQARLISSVSPAYPAFARSMGLQGDITIDALIDATGKVTAMKPLSGPVPLQQAAMDALRQWNYEPARFDGQAVSTHVSVTMKFRLK
jgi:TonB family protein